MRIHLSSIYCAICLFIYKSLLDYIYCNYIAVIWFREGFINNSGFENYLVSTLIFVMSLILFVPIFRDRGEHGSTIVITGLYLIYFIPFLTCVYAGLFPQYEYVFLGCVYWFILCGTELYFLSSHSVKCITFGQVVGDNGNKIIGFLAFFLSVVVLYVSYRYTGFRIHFDLNSVYELRFEARTWGGGFILGYVLSWAGALLPIIMAYYASRRDFFYTALIFCISMFNFGIEGHKSVLMSILLVLVFMLFFRKASCLVFKKYMLIGVIVLHILAVVEMQFIEVSKIMWLLTFRVLFVPVRISWCYYDFFQTHPFDYFRSSFLRHFGVVSPYSDVGIDFWIGEVYSPYGIECRANNGLIADALTNWGYVGIILMPIIVAILLRLLDRMTHKINKNIVQILSILLCLQLTNVFLLPILLTGGLLILCFVLIVMQSQCISNQGDTIG